MDHESIRIYCHRIKRILKTPRKKKRRTIAIDETKLKLELKLEDRQILQMLILRDVCPSGLLRVEGTFMLTFSLKKFSISAKISRKWLLMEDSDICGLQRGWDWSTGKRLSGRGIQSRSSLASLLSGVHLILCRGGLQRFIITGGGHVDSPN